MSLDQNRANELEADIEFQAIMEEQAMIEAAHPRISKRHKLKKNGPGTKMATLYNCSHLHSLGPNASADEICAAIDRIWPRVPHLSTSGKMTDVSWDRDTNDLSFRIKITLHRVIDALKDPMVVPYLAKCSQDAIHARTHKRVES